MRTKKFFLAFQFAVAMAMIIAASFSGIAQATNNSEMAPVITGAASGKPDNSESGKRQPHRESEPASGADVRGLGLKLSARPLDESGIAKVSPDERELLREKQKLFDAEDRVRSYLALQHQVKQMQAEIAALEPRVAQLGLGRSPPAATPPVADSKGATTSENILWRASVGAGLALFAAWALFFGLRRYRMAKSQHGSEAWEPPDLPVYPPASPAVTESRNPPSVDSPGALAHAKTLPPSAVDAKEADAMAEVDSMIEEAELYAIHGHPDKAIEILNEIVQEYPRKVEVWLLLLSIFRSEKNARQFESIARKFLITVGGGEAWKGIQEAGRSIDPGNPLYFDSGSSGTTNAGRSIIAGRRLLGDILVDMNAISVRNLETCLANFDHLRDGRLGDYLVARGLVSPAELDEALRQQSKEAAAERSSLQVDAGVHVPPIKAGKPRTVGDVLVQTGVVTEQELDSVLSNYDPKRHGRCGTYLVTCGLITKEQLHAALLQQLGGAMAVGFAAPGEEPDGSSDRILWDMPDRLIR